jgi:hypothetical protein
MESSMIGRKALASYLAGRFHGSVEALAVRRLKRERDGADDPKGFGYGAPFEVELLEVLPPFFAFRALVIAHPRWYPTLTDATRQVLLGFAHGMVRPDAFDRRRVQAVLRGSP